MKRADQAEMPYSGDLFGELYLAEKIQHGETSRLRNLLPGLAICAVGSGAAAWLSDHYGMPVILLGLLIGLSLNFVTRDAATHAGLDFASRNFLRIGIILLGLQISYGQIEALGVQPFIALLLIMSLTFAAGLVGARISGQSRYAGILAGGATAICGASAALALYGVVGKDRLSQAQFALTLVGVSLASALAMSLYPALAGEMGLNDQQAGYLIGASVHDVAQAIGGAYSFSDAAGSHATIVKLARVTLLAPVVLLVSMWLGSGGEREARPIWRRISIPWFIIAFLGVVAFNSVVAMPGDARALALSLSKALLLVAVTATAMRSRMDLLMELGWRAVVPVLAATLMSLCASLLFVLRG
ncbi:YeiH family protein [Sphingomonas cavernae]|uniref:Putative sulfate exporter family transporter n=1 Tax=Sphingomonas cavernae TaxID=2320861 RepID=A0A418WKM4_9SPHN|nr:putative sulfate exporter family transporter [Sphingomonas cavernae]RJF90584.1 putative sulfate exporter family transporter [Sphingomonas cavernae]